MPTVITHALVPLAFGAAFGRRAVSPRLLLAGAFAAILPDLDVLAFPLGIPYADAFGHRGATHSTGFALIVGIAGALGARALRSSAGHAFAWLAACTLSHPLLDALTNGGLGVALLWPFHDGRFFAPWRPVQVSPIGAGFLGARGVAVLWSEARWILLPAVAMSGCVALALLLRRNAGGGHTGVS